MKKILLLLLLATFSIQAQTLQNPTYGNVKLKNNVTDNSATKVNVQSTDGTINTISKSDLVNVVEVNDVPSLPLVGEVGKIYVVKNVNKIYRWNGTFCQELAGSDLTYQSVIDALTFTPENVANKQNSLTTDGSGIRYPTVDAINADKSTSIVNAITLAGWGDSITFGTGSTIYGKGYLNQLSKISGYSFFNGGVAGETSTEIKNRFLLDTGKHSYPSIIWVGHNNYSSPTTVKSDIAAMVSALGHQRFIILSILNGEYVPQYAGNADYVTITTLNNDLATLYGSRYIDIRAYLVSQYNPSIPQDVVDFGHDIVPSSLRSDNLHLNDLGYKKVAEKIKLSIQLLSGTSEIATKSLFLPSFASPPVIGASVKNYAFFKELYPDKIGINTENIGVGSGALFESYQPISGAGNLILKHNSPKISTANEYPFYISSNDLWSDNPFVLELSVKGSPILENRKVSFQTLDMNLAVGGIISFQNTGGRVITGGVVDDGVTKFQGTTSSFLNIATSQILSNSEFVFANKSQSDYQDIKVKSISATGHYVGGAALTGIPTAPTAALGTNTTQIATTAFVQANSRPYKVYTALLSQSGTNAPTATVLENTLGGSVVWARSTTGVYYATSGYRFTDNKTTVFINNHRQDSNVTIECTNNNNVSVSTYGTSVVPFSGVDGRLLNNAIEIRVYL